MRAYHGNYGECEVLDLDGKMATISVPVGRIRKDIKRVRASQLDIYPAKAEEEPKKEPMPIYPANRDQLYKIAKGTMVVLADGRIGKLVKKTKCPDLKDGAVVDTGGYRIEVDLEGGGISSTYLSRIKGIKPKDKKNEAGL